MPSTASAAFRGEPTDVVPVYHLGFSSDIASALLGRTAYVGGGSQQWREATAWWQGEDAHDEFLERSFQDAIDVALLVDHDMGLVLNVSDRIHVIDFGKTIAVGSPDEIRDNAAVIGAYLGAGGGGE